LALSGPEPESNLLFGTEDTSFAAFVLSHNRTIWLNVNLRLLSFETVSEHTRIINVYLRMIGEI